MRAFLASEIDALLSPHPTAMRFSLSRWTRGGRVPANRGDWLLVAPVVLSVFILLASQLGTGLAVQPEGPNGGSARVVQLGASTSVLYPRCELGTATGTEWYWVPVIVVNSPFGEAASATGSESSVVKDSLSLSIDGIGWSGNTSTTNSWTINASGGSTEGLFELTKWTVWSLVNGTSTLPPADVCTSPYTAEFASGQYDYGLQTEQLAGVESSTANIPYNISYVVTGENTPVYGQSISTIGGLDSLGYASDNDKYISTCSVEGTANEVTTATLATETWGINLGAAYNGVSVSGGFSFVVASGSDTSYTYKYPTGGTWNLDSLPGGAGGLLAFDETGCTMGGGGCVAYGTPILALGRSGWVYTPVQNLKAGATVAEYNLSLGRLVTGTLVSANTTSVGSLVSINEGQLELTPTDQPIFISNATYTGWLHDPQNLTTADFMFDPVTESWVRVTSLKVMSGDFTVYDVVTGGANNFVANGALLDIKTP